MSTLSNARIFMGPKAYELLENNFLASKSEEVRKLITEPYIIEKGRVCYVNGYEKEDAVYIGWNSLKWFPYYDDIKIILNTIRELNKIVEEDEEDDKLQDYFYKMIVMFENNSITVETNDENEEYTEEFYVECKFSFD